MGQEESARGRFADQTGPRRGRVSYPEGWGGLDAEPDRTDSDTVEDTEPDEPDDEVLRAGGQGPTAAAAEEPALPPDDPEDPPGSGDDPPWDPATDPADPRRELVPA